MFTIILSYEQTMPSFFSFFFFSILSHHSFLSYFLLTIAVYFYVLYLPYSSLIWVIPLTCIFILGAMNPPYQCAEMKKESFFDMNPAVSTPAFQTWKL